MEIFLSAESKSTSEERGLPTEMSAIVGAVIIKLKNTDMG